MIGLPVQGAGAVGAGTGARDTAQPPPPSAPQAGAAEPQAPPQPGPPVALSAAATAQGGLAPLLADVMAAVARPDLPAAVRAAADRVLSFGLDEDEPPTGADLQVLVGRSGLFLEAALAAGAPPADDFKAMLLDLAETLKDWSGDVQSGKPSLKAAPPPPPFGGGPVRGQGAAPAGIGPGAQPDAVAARLLAETQAALARHALMQAASAADPARTDEHEAPATRWLFELPVARPDGRSVAQFEVARDGRRRAGADAGPTWRARFSLDVAGLGPVHTAMALSGGRLHVALWAEEPATQAALAGRQGQLREALQDDGLSAEVVVRAGAPSTAPPPAGRFMDTAA